MQQLSTYQLAELVSTKLKGKVSSENVMLMWANVGAFINSQILQRKGVKLNLFGTFTFDNDGAPYLLVSNEISSRCKCRQLVLKPSNIPIVNVNFTQVANGSNSLTRESVDKMYTTFIAVLFQLLTENRSVSLTMRGVIEMTFNEGILKYNFSSDLLDALNAPKGGFTGLDASQKHLLNKSLSATNLNISKPSDTKIFNATVKRNPILGTDTRPFSSSALGVSGNSGNEYSRSRDSNDVPKGRMHSGQSNRSSSDIRNVFGQTKQQLSLVNVPVEKSTSKFNNTGNSISGSRLGYDTPEVVKKFKDKIVQRGGTMGIQNVSRLLAIMDNNGDKKLSKEELKYGMKDYGVELSSNEIDLLFDYFDRDKSGSIDLDEFLIGLKGDLNEKRRQLINMAFNCLDKDGSGQVTTEELADTYDFTHHPDVRSGKLTIAQALKDFMKQWDRLNPDGIITLEEFEDYYKGISASIDRDDYFELMIRNAWRIAGGEGMAANTANKRVLVTNKDGSQSVQTLENELGWKAGDKEGLRARLNKQGIDASNVELHGGIDTRPKGGQFQPPKGSTGNRPKSPGVYPNTAVTRVGNANAKPPSRQMSARTQILNSAKTSGVFDPAQTLQTLLYQPRRSVVELAQRLSVSSTVSNPSVTQAGFSTKLNTYDASLTRDQLKEIWKLIDPKNMKTITLQSLHEYLSSRFGKDKTSTGSSVIDKVRAKILERCGSNGGMKGLQRCLSIMDNSGNKRLDKHELRDGLRDYGLELNTREIDEIFIYFDRDRSGEIDFTEFIVGVRGDMNDRRKKLVRMAFNILDKDGSGELNVDEIMSIYDVSKHPDVLAGKKTPREAIEEFMKQWDGNDNDGIITYDEFEDYYKEISASIDGDDYFELMIRNAWRIAGGEGMAANTANKRVLVTNKDGSQSVQTLENELGWKAGDKEGLRARLSKQGIDASNVELHGGIDTRSKGGQFQPPKSSTSNRPKSPLAHQRPSSNNNTNQLNVRMQNLNVSRR